MSRLQTLWNGIRDSLWFLPATLTLAAFLLAVLTVWVDQSIFNDGRWPSLWWLVGGGPEGARAMLSSIASGIITVTGVVFSVTIVALQLASSQYTPRLLRHFTADRAVQLVLGVFIATFTYALIVLRAVSSETDAAAAFVPSLSVTVAVALALVSIGFLIFFIDHVARSIQVSHIVDRVTSDTLGVVDTLFPEPIGRPASEQELYPVVLGEERDATAIEAAEAGYLQSVDERTLVEQAGGKRLVVRMMPKIGDFVLPGMVLAWAWPAAQLDPKRQEAVRRAFILGPERTPYQDVEYGIISLMDIAVRALSPGINDPTTARVCVDRLGEILLALGTREIPSRLRTGKEGQLLLVLRRTTFEDAVTIALDQVRHYGVSNPAVAVRILETLRRVAELLPPDRREPLFGEAIQTLRAARDAIGDGHDRARVEAAAEHVLALRHADAETEGAAPAAGAPPGARRAG